MSFFGNTNRGPAEKPNAHPSPRVEVTPCEEANAAPIIPAIKPTMVMAVFGDMPLRWLDSPGELPRGFEIEGGL